jgi:uncharacterized membrane protein
MFQIMPKDWQKSQPWWLLLLWVIIGAILRLTNLDGKPPWTDEFATIVLSLGNSFKSVPLDRVISFQDLIQPLIPNPSATVGDVTHLIFTEDHHPPTYFAIAHLWMQLFPTDGGLVNLWGARALPALFGILAIPVSYLGSYLTFKSSAIAQLTAAMMAVSPYGVYISQEARHYSLGILGIIISLSCLARATTYLSQNQKIPLSLLFGWILVNNFGIATHYFFSIALVAEFLAIGIFFFQQVKEVKNKHRDHGYLDISKSIVMHPSWRRLYAAILGTAVGVAFWFWLLARSYDSTMTEWIKNEPHKLIEVFNPFFQIIGTLIPMMSLLLVEVSNLPVVIFSGIIMLVFFIWVTPLLKRGITYQWQQPQTKTATVTIIGFAASAIGLYLTIPWLTGMDVTRGARYHFVYFPGIIMLVGLALAACWESRGNIAKLVSGKQAVVIVLLMGLVSSAIVANNYGYRKYYRPEQLTPLIQESAPIPVLIATTHNSLVQVGEMMGLAWQMRRSDRLNQIATTKFLFAHQRQTICEEKDCPATEILRHEVERLRQPLDLWLLNFRAPVSLPPNCHQDKQFMQGIYGYEHKLYHCDNIKDIGQAIGDNG